MRGAEDVDARGKVAARAGSFPPEGRSEEGEQERGEREAGRAVPGEGGRGDPSRGSGPLPPLLLCRAPPLHAPAYLSHHPPTCP